MGVSNVIRFIKGEFSGWGAAERFLFPLALIVPVFISFLINDSKMKNEKQENHTLIFHC